MACDEEGMAMLGRLVATVGYEHVNRRQLKGAFGRSSCALFSKTRCDRRSCRKASVTDVNASEATCKMASLGVGKKPEGEKPVGCFIGCL